MANLIEDFAKERGIKYLMHFTKLENLGSIEQRGLVTRDVLVAEGNVAALNDKDRHDHTDAVCLSIGFPNYKMFWGLRQDNKGTDWVVVAVDVSALWQLPCALLIAPVLITLRYSSRSRSTRSVSKPRACSDT